MIKLGVFGVLALVAVVLLLLGADLKEWVKVALDFVRGLGPVAFFTAMALAPAVGAPVLAFSLPAGPLFGERLGMGTVIALASLAIVVNLVLTYVLARWAFRPLLARFVDWLGYRMPRLDSGDAADLVLILRLTPGVPFFVQNYLLGLAEVSLVKYLLMSCAISLSFNAGFVVFGEALLQGRGKVALLSFSALLALMALAHLVRRHLAPRTPSPRS